MAAATLQINTINILQPILQSVVQHTGVFSNVATAPALNDKIKHYSAFRVCRLTPVVPCQTSHRAWRKRQANISEIRKQHEYETTFHSNSSNSSSSSNFTSGWASFFNQHVEFRSNNSTNDPDDGDTNGYDGEAVNRDPERKHIANLAAAASRAMRRWRMHHTVVSATAQKVLCDAKSE